MTIDSEAHEVFKKLIYAPKFVNDFKHMTKPVHTGKLENFHSQCTVYFPKRLAFPYQTMDARIKLAVIDYNSNVGRQQAKVSRETSRS